MTEKLVTGDEFKEGIQRGINKLADAVKDTLGPMGKTVLIRNAFGESTITKDGVSVAEEIFLEEPLERVGSELVKNVAIKANNLAGDGTTTATVLSQAIYNKGLKAIKLGETPLEFSKGMRAASQDLLTTIKKTTKLVDTNSPELHKVAMVSCNGDKKIAATITNIYKELGIHAVISVVQGDSVHTEVNVVKGMQFDRGFLSPYCVTDKIKNKAVVDNAFVFIYDGKISDANILLPVLEHAGEKGRPVVIVSEGVQDSALRMLIVNHVGNNVKSAAVLSPGYGKKRFERLLDMAVLFDAEVYSPESDMKDFVPEHLGEVLKAEITNTDTAFMGGAGHNEKIQARVEHIQSQLDHYKGKKYEVDILEERLGKLTSGVAMIKVGAHSDEESKELLDRVEDCKHAVRAALSEGVVEGGGMALYNASIILEKLAKKKNVSDSYKAGYTEMLSAVKVPFRQILINAEIIPEVIEENLKNKRGLKGYDVLNAKYVRNMVSAGIIDPFKVIRIALESSTSIISTLLTSNYAVLNKDDVTTTNFR